VAARLGRVAGPGLPASGPAGTYVQIGGHNFTGATAVKFNGVSASFAVNCFEDGGAGARGRGRRGPGTGAAVREARGAPGLKAVYGWTTHCRIGDGWHTDTRGTVLRRMVGPVIGVSGRPIGLIPGSQDGAAVPGDADLAVVAADDLADTAAAAATPAIGCCRTACRR